MSGLHGSGAPINRGNDTMTTRSRGPLAGFGWLNHGFSLGCRHPKPLLGGAALLLLVCVLPSLITMPMQLHSAKAGIPLSPAAFGWIMAGSALVGLLIVPLYAGYLQVIDAAERGLPARARDIFKPYRQGEAWRLIGYGLVMLVVYIALLGIIVAATGGSIAHWYMQVLAAQANHLPPPTALPDGFGTAMALLTVVGLFMMGFYAISLGQIALGERSVFGAVGDGMIGALKNLLPLLVFAVNLVIAWIVVIIAFVLVAIVLALLGKFVSVWLAIALLVPLYIVVVLGIFTVMFGVMYCLWRDVCGDDVASGTATSIAV